MIYWYGANLKVIWLAGVQIGSQLEKFHKSRWATSRNPRSNEQAGSETGSKTNLKNAEKIFETWHRINCNDLAMKEGSNINLCLDRTKWTGQNIFLYVFRSLKTENFQNTC